MWVQKRDFHLCWMGDKKNFCLKNVREGYAIPPKWATAKEAMNENAKKGALHSLDSIPTNVAVPVYSNAGQWGHVIVCDHGVYYDDHKKTRKPNNSFKWGEWVNGVHVVVWKDDVRPASIKVGDTAIVWKDDVRPASIKVGDTAIVNGCGTATSKGAGNKTRPYKNQKMKVIDIKNGRYGCNQYNKQGAITGWWESNQVKKG